MYPALHLPISLELFNIFGFRAALWTQRDGLAPHLHHFQLQIVLARQILQPPHMVHMDFLGFRSAQLANASFQPSCETVRLGVFHILREYVGG